MAGGAAKASGENRAALNKRKSGGCKLAQKKACESEAKNGGGVAGMRGKAPVSWRQLCSSATSPVAIIESRLHAMSAWRRNGWYINIGASAWLNHHVARGGNRLMAWPQCGAA